MNLADNRSERSHAHGRRKGAVVNLIVQRVSPRHDIEGTGPASDVVRVGWLLMQT